MDSIHRPPELAPDLDRQRRKWRVVLIVGIVLCCGPALGILGTIVGMLESRHKIDTLRAPTPDDLAGGAELSELTTTIGLFAAVVGAVLAGWALVKLNRLRVRAETDFWK